MPDPASQPLWLRRLAALSAGIMAVVWLVAGLWKLTNISQFQLMLHQMLVPVALTLPATLLVAGAETLAGVLLLRPAWRRWGGLLSTLLLVVFMVYIGLNYETLRGEDCSCFPWLERTVGPAFFWSDGAMVALSLLAAWVAPPQRPLSSARWVAAAVVVLLAAGLAYDRLAPAQGSDVPETITVDGQPYPLRQGKVFLYFFNPTCLHCLDVGILLSEYEFEADFIGVPTQEPDFVPGFLDDAGLSGKVKISPDLELLKQSFEFEDVPYAAVVDQGKVLARLQFFEEPELGRQLRELGVVR